MSSPFVILFIIYKDGSVRAYPNVTWININKKKNRMEIKCYFSEFFWAMNMNDIEKVYTVGGLERSGKFYYYRKHTDDYIQLPILTINLMRFDVYHRDVNNGNPMDKNMKIISKELSDWVKGKEMMLIADNDYFDDIVKATFYSINGEDKVYDIDTKGYEWYYK